MKIIYDLIRKIQFDLTCDRLGPDIIFTHWKLYFKNKANNLCKKKFGAFGKGSIVRPGAYIISCKNIFIGSQVIIRPDCHLYADADAKIVIEDDVLMGSGVHIYVNNHRYDDPHLPISEQGYYPSQDVKIKKGAWIGANAILLPGVIIGRNAVVGAGSVVTKSVASCDVVAGVPARLIRKATTAWQV